ncbi:MAG: hypothetical protein JNK47_06045 [Mesorhizobium sp.]|nr:hypothetical protein [Mesorhizobium sp.]MBL8576766.1 hypothetical protein [Mesorhizobium sp.]
MKSRAGSIATGLLVSFVVVSTATAEDPVVSATPQVAPSPTTPDATSLGRSTGLLDGACGILNETYSGPCSRLTQGLGNELSGGGIAYGSWRAHKGLGGINSNLVTDTDLIRRLSPILGNDVSAARIRSLAPVTRRLSALPAIRHAPKVGVFLGAGIIAYEYFFDTEASGQSEIAPSIPGTAVDPLARRQPDPFLTLPAEEGGSLFEKKSGSAAQRMIMEGAGSNQPPAPAVPSP